MQHCVGRAAGRRDDDGGVLEGFARAMSRGRMPRASKFMTALPLSTA